MVSQLAMCEARGLVSDGVVLTPEEIIHLNDLGIEIERAAACIIAAPRVAWAGSVPIYQPTLQGELWYRDYACEWWRDESAFYALAWSMAHGMESGFFLDKTDKKQVRAQILKWYRDIDATLAQVEAAVEYALKGTREPWRLPGDKDEEPEEGPVSCPYTELVNQALATVGIDRKDLLCMTPGGILDIINRATRLIIAQGGGHMDSGNKSLKETAKGRFYQYLTFLKGRENGKQ